MSALYYCHACGMRLKPEDVETAVARGESHATACCDACARQGKRVKDPRTVDVPVAAPAQNSPSNHSPLELGEAPARIPPRVSGRVDRATPARAPTGPIRRAAASPPSGILRPETSRAARNSPASGMRLDGIRARTATPAAPPRLETAQSARVTRKAGTAPSDRKGGERATKNSGLPLAAVLGGVGAIIFLIGIVLATRTNRAPREAEARANNPPTEGDSGVKPSEDKKPPIVLSGADERRVADFERNLPQTIGAPPKSGVFYGPMGAGSQVVWKEGTETLHKIEGRPPYLDGTRKIYFQVNGVAGTISKEPIVIEYSATCDIDANIVLDVADYGNRSGTVRFPAGSLQKIEINPEDERTLNRGKSGKPSGKAISGIGVDPRGVQPGTFGIFRISR